MNAYDFLEQIEKIDTLINNKLIEVAQWKALAISTTSNLNPDKVQSTGSQQKMAEAVEHYLDIEREINECIDTLYDVKRDVLSKIEKLKADEYDMLHKVYVQYMPVKVVAEKYDKSYSWAIKLHARAIKHLEEVLLNENT